MAGRIIIAGLKLIGARVALTFGARAGVNSFLKYSASQLTKRGLVGITLKTGIRKVGRLAVNVIKSPLKWGVRTFAGLKAVGILTASLLGAQLLGGVLTNLWSAIVNTSSYVVNFNINTTDDELLEQLKSRLESFYGLLGATVGSSMGYLVCGAIPGALSFAFNPAVGAAIMRDLDDEARSEVLGQVNGIARTAFQTLINAKIAEQFKSSRRFLKQNPNNPFAKIVRRQLGEDGWKKWGDSNQPSFTISQNIIQKSIDANPDKGTRDFLENAIENFSDSCIEAGFIVANNLDSQLAANALMQRAVLGRQTDVSITIP
jgi:hypothetical protein